LLLLDALQRAPEAALGVELQGKLDGPRDDAHLAREFEHLINARLVANAEGSVRNQFGGKDLRRSRAVALGEQARLRRSEAGGWLMGDMQPRTVEEEVGKEPGREPRAHVGLLCQLRRERVDAPTLEVDLATVHQPSAGSRRQGGARIDESSP